MSRTARRAQFGWSSRIAACLFVATVASGCPSSKGANEALDRQIKENPQFKKEEIAKFAGRVTVDGQPPAKEWKLFVILTDPKHLDENKDAARPKLYRVCDDEGRFAFGTYDKDDGVVAGKYVVTFVELHSPLPAAMKQSGGRFVAPVGSVGGKKAFIGPDELKNLYSDPDKNVKEDRFSLDLQPPGKADWEFDLAVAGKETAVTGPNAVTKIGGR